MTRASKIEQWTDKEGNRRPTPERRKRGAYRLVDGENAGERYAYDDCSTPLRHAHFHTPKKLTKTELEAGERFEALCRIVRGSPGPRSCLDWSPRGYGETPTEYHARAWSEFKDIGWGMGKVAFNVMISVCYFHEATGPRRDDAFRWKRLKQGLEFCRKYWGLPEDDD